MPVRVQVPSEAQERGATAPLSCAMHYLNPCHSVTSPSGEHGITLHFMPGPHGLPLSSKARPPVRRLMAPSPPHRSRGSSFCVSDGTDAPPLPSATAPVGHAASACASGRRPMRLPSASQTRLPVAAPDGAFSAAELLLLSLVLRERSPALQVLPRRLASPVCSCRGHIGVVTQLTGTSEPCRCS